MCAVCVAAVLQTDGVVARWLAGWLADAAVPADRQGCRWWVGFCQLLSVDGCCSGRLFKFPAG